MNEFFAATLALLVLARKRYYPVGVHAPLISAVSLPEGIWKGEQWSAHLADVAALALVFAICTVL